MNEYKIYPKQFQFEKIMIQKNTCFMIMSFDSKFDGIYGTIKDEFEKHQIICNRADEMNGSQPIVNKIINGILESQYIVVDITDAKPNVFYELGIAHSFRDARNILIIKQQSTDYPFDISHLPYHEYNCTNLYKLKSIISTFITESQIVTDFREALSINDIYDYTVNGTTNYIEYVENYFKDNLNIYSQILNQKAAIYGEKRVEGAFVEFEAFIIKNLSSYNTCNGVQREHNKKLNNGLPILHKVPPKRDYGRYFCIMAEKGGTSHGGLTEKLSPFFHAKKQEVNAYGR